MIVIPSTMIKRAGYLAGGDRLRVQADFLENPAQANSACSESAPTPLLSARLYLNCTLGCATHRTYGTHRISEPRNLRKLSGFEEVQAVRVLLAERKPLGNTRGFLLASWNCTVSVPLPLTHLPLSEEA
jgi:hypothetical protein